jgi:hypothetical protein
MFSVVASNGHKKHKLPTTAIAAYYSITMELAIHILWQVLDIAVVMSTDLIQASM